jgi:hypothetical protein
MIASSLPQPGREVALVRSRLGRDAVALGAATLPLDRFIERGWPTRSAEDGGRGARRGRGASEDGASGGDWSW